DRILVPLRSPRGHLLGCLLLDQPQSVQRITAEEIAAVEMLSADLAISMENSHLQRQLVLSEKLAGLGKLVAGAGHELNNPLTAVLGYAEMLAASVDDEGTRHSAEVIRREALRMKQIIENLHGGEIRAQNLHPSGASIVIELPIANPAERTPQPTEVAKA